MELKKPASAGTTDKNDILIQVSPSESGVEILLTSKVMEQFGDNIKETIINTLNEMGVHSVNLVAEDNGAIEVVIESRVQAAILRAAESTDYIWR